MSRPHSAYMVKVSPSMRDHRSNNLPILYLQSPFPFYITFVSIISVDRLYPLGYLYHFTDEEVKDQR